MNINLIDFLEGEIANNKLDYPIELGVGTVKEIVKELKGEVEIPHSEIPTEVDLGTITIEKLANGMNSYPVIHFPYRTLRLKGSITAFRRHSMNLMQRKLQLQLSQASGTFPDNHQGFAFVYNRTPIYIMFSDFLVTVGFDGNLDPW